MDTLRFQTNINSEKQLEKAALEIDKLEGITTWNVDIHSLYHLLTIKGIGVDPLIVINKLEVAGFTILQMFEE